MHGYIYIYIGKYMYIYIYVYIYAYAHMYIYISTTRACAPVQRCSSFLAMEVIANLSWVLREHLAGCRFRPPSCPFVEPAALLLARWPTCSLRNPSESTLAHDAVAAVVLHEHHLIIRVGAGLIQFVYGSHSRLAVDLTLDKNLFSLPFSRVSYALSHRFFWQAWLRSLKRHPITLMSLKTWGFLEKYDIDGSGIFSISFFVICIETCKIVTSQVTTIVSYTRNLITTPDMTMPLPAHAECHRWRIEVRVTRVTTNVRPWKYKLVRRRKPKST